MQPPSLSNKACLAFFYTKHVRFDLRLTEALTDHGLGVLQSKFADFGLVKTVQAANTCTTGRIAPAIVLVARITSDGRAASRLFARPQWREPDQKVPTRSTEHAGIWRQTARSP
jgi:hypothetical protein